MSPYEAIDGEMTLAFCTVWDAATNDDVNGMVDSDLLLVLAGAAKVTELAGRARKLAEAAIQLHHPKGGWKLGEADVGQVRTVPRFKTTHDIGQAFTAVACRIYGEATDSPVDAVELPIQIKTLVSCLAGLFPASTTLSLPAARLQGLADEDVVVKTPIDAKVEFTPAAGS